MIKRKIKKPEANQEKLFRDTAKLLDCDDKIDLKEILKKIAKPSKPKK